MQIEDNLKMPFPGSNKKSHATNTEKSNSLPPFLLVRSGLLTEPILLALVLIPLAECVFSKKTGLSADFLTVCSYAVPMIAFISKFFCMSNEKEQIQQNLEKYVHKEVLNLTPISKYDHKLMAKIIMKHISKQDPRLFDKMMQIPETVNDEKTATAIIDGYLKVHPNSAKIILNKFDSIPKNLKKRLEKIAEKQH